MKKQTISAILLSILSVLFFINIDTSAGYDRFKVVGVDALKNKDSITVIQDTETGCLYMRSTRGQYGIDTDPILNKEGKPDCK